MIEERAVVIALENGHLARVEAVTDAGCGNCAASGRCGTGLLTGLFRQRQRQLTVENSLGVAAGETVIIGLDRFAMLMASLLTYLLPLLMLLAGAITGEQLALTTGHIDSDSAAIIGGLAGGVLAVPLVRRLTAGLAGRLHPGLLRRD